MTKEEQEDRLRRRALALAQRKAQIQLVSRELAFLKSRLNMELSNWSEDLVRSYDKRDTQKESTDEME